MDFWNFVEGAQSSRDEQEVEYEARKFLGLSKRLFLPKRIVYEAAAEHRRAEEMRKQAEAIKEQQKAEAREAVETERGPNAEDPGYLPMQDEVLVFPPETIQRAEKIGKSRDESKRVKPLIDMMSANAGYRYVVPIEGPAVIAALSDEFPHFAEAIDLLEASFARAALLPAESRVIQPVWLSGEPGVGKTMFAERLAELIGAPFEKANVGTSQGGFTLSGSDSHWSNTAPGRVFFSLAERANPVLLIDEVDKIGHGEHGATTEAALLDLLEKRTARNFRDDCIGADMNAAHIVILVAGNDEAAVSEPLKTRMAKVHVTKPSAFQMLQIVQRIVRAELKQLPDGSGPEVADSAIEQLARSGLSPREIRRVVELGVGLALARQQDRILAFTIGVAADVARQKVGFV